MEAVVFVVTQVDRTKSRPSVNVAYAGVNLQEAVSRYDILVDNHKESDITLSVVQGVMERTVSHHEAVIIELPPLNFV